MALCIMSKCGGGVGVRSGWERFFMGWGWLDAKGVRGRT